MELFSKPPALTARLAVLASLVIHACLLLLQLHGGQSDGLMDAPLQPLQIRLANAEALPQASAVQLFATGRVNDGTLHKASSSAMRAAEIAAAPPPARQGFSWMPPSGPDQPAATDPMQAARLAYARQSQMQAIAMALSEVTTQLSSEVTGEHRCQQGQDLQVQCEFASHESWADLFTQWLALASQARNLGMASAEQEIKGQNGRLVVRLL